MVFSLQRGMTVQQHQRREVQDWLNLFEQQKQSGLTAVEFCRQQLINVQTYYTRAYFGESDRSFRFYPITFSSSFSSLPVLP